MSFRLFIFYCSACGAWAAFAGWALGRLPDLQGLARPAVQGLYLGLLLALALTLVDTLWNFSLRQVGQLVPRVGIVLLVGGFGGLVGGTVGQLLLGLTDWSAVLVFGWTLTGLLIGASFGTFDLLSALVQGRDVRGARRKLRNGLLGGVLGGALGGTLFVFLHQTWEDFFAAKGEAALDRLWSPSAVGFVVLGACIGLLIGLAQVILKEAWVQVEAGLRKGRQVILSKPETTIGRAEACDIGLFGDPGIDRLHARILQQGGQYYLADAGSGGGTYLNDRRVVQPAPLQAGDAIRLGNCVLRFGERRKK